MKKIIYLLFLILYSCSDHDPRIVKVPETLDSNNNKISDKLEKNMELLPLKAGKNKDIDVIIALNIDPEYSLLASRLSGAKYLYKTSSLVYALYTGMDRDSIVEIAGQSEVVLIEENYKVKTDLMNVTKQIDVRQFWSSYKGSGYKLAVVDTGIDGTHNDFSSRIDLNVNCYEQTSCLEGALSSNNDDNSHGTHVAGIVLGSGASWDSSDNGVAYIEKTGYFPETGYGIPMYITAQYKDASTNGYYGAKMTWQGVSNSLSELLTMDEIQKPGGGTAFFDAAGTKSNPPVSVSAGEYITDSDVTDMAASSSELISPFAFIASTSDPNQVGAPFFAQIKVPVQGWTGDSESPLSGIAPEADLVSVKALNSSGSGSISDVIRSYEYINSVAASRKIIAMNSSFSIGGNTTSAVLNAAAANLVNNGVLVVVSAGNEQGVSAVSSPGNEPKVLTVGAINELDQVTDYTSIGSLEYGVAIKPDVLAPGGSSVTKVYVTAPKTTDSDLSIWNINEGVSHDPYTLKVGTSQAAPVVTGLAGLMAQKRGNSWSFSSPDLPNLFKAIICMTATEVGSAESGAESPGISERAGALKDVVEGYGKLSAPGAMGALSTWDFSASDSDSFSFGPEPYDMKSFARAVTLLSDHEYNFTMDVPVSSDYDLYLFSGTPDQNGEPVLKASSALADQDTEQIIDFIPETSGTYYIVAKWVSGSGSGNISLLSAQSKPSTPTVISNFLVTKNMRDKVVTVYWNTNVPALSAIQYGVTGGLETSESNSEYNTSHSFSFSIDYNNYYYLRVMSSSSGTNELEVSTAVSEVYKINANTGSDVINSNPELDDLPVVPVGGCGNINSINNINNKNAGLVLFIMLIPVMIMIYIRIKIFLLLRIRSLINVFL